MTNLINSRSIRITLLPLIILAAVLMNGWFWGCSGLKTTPFYSGGAVATASPIATDIGVEIMKGGGNAFDAAIAVGFVLAVVHPQAGNIGGGGFAVVRDGRNGEITTLDFRETAPGAAGETMYQDSLGEVVDSLSTVGALASGVPGTVAGLHQLWQKYGSLEWADLVYPAAALADSGFIVDSYLADYFDQYREELGQFVETKVWLMPEGRVPSEGDRWRQAELSGTLMAIALEGPEAFYKGLVSEQLLACMARHGGLISSEDLSAYEPVWRDPINFRFDSLQIYGMAPPSSGGLMVGQILKLIEPYDLSVMTPGSPEFVHLFAEASRRAFADRSVHLGDPSYWGIPELLLDDSYLDQRRETIRPGQASSSEEISPGLPYRHESDETTHFSIADAKGNVVALTYTLNDTFGNKLVVEGAGFLLNNQMDDFSAKPGAPNLYGLVGAEANKIEPGKRMLSSMSPTIVMKQGQPFLVLGSKGGSRIITAVAQVILNVTRFEMNPEEALAFPRAHHQWLPDQIRLEEGGFDMDCKQELIRYGHFIEEKPHGGNVQMILFDHAGLMAPASDPRHRGTGGGF